MNISEVEKLTIAELESLTLKQLEQQLEEIAADIRLNNQPVPYSLIVKTEYLITLLDDETFLINQRGLRSAIYALPCF